MTNKVYIVEKKFKEFFSLMARTDLYIRETPEKTFVISVPHPLEDIEYVLTAYRNGQSAKAFVDLGRCVRVALDLGAASIHFELADTSQA